MADRLFEPTAVQVGKPHPLLYRQLSTLHDGCMPIIIGGIPIMVVLMTDPRPEEIRSLNSGWLRIGLMPLRPFGYAWFFAHQFGDLEAAFSPCLEPPDRRELSRRDDDVAAHRWVHLHVVELPGAYVRAIRVFTVPPAFSAELEMLHAQARSHQGEFTRQRWDHSLETLWRTVLPDGPSSVWKSGLLTAEHRLDGQT